MGHKLELKGKSADQLELDLGGALRSKEAGAAREVSMAGGTVKASWQGQGEMNSERCKKTPGSHLDLRLEPGGHGGFRHQDLGPPHTKSPPPCSGPFLSPQPGSRGPGRELPDLKVSHHSQPGLIQLRGREVRPGLSTVWRGQPRPSPQPGPWVGPAKALARNDLISPCSLDGPYAHLQT